MRIVAGCFLAFTGVLAWAQNGPVVPLQGELLAVRDRFMVDWQKHDTAAMASLLAPGFVYVGSNGPMPRADVLHDLARNAS